MLAAIFDHVDVARLLLAAGADVRLQDNLGLTAREWADRRGSWEVAQLLSNSSPAEIVASQKSAPEKQARTKVEAERRNPAAEAKTTHQQEPPSVADEQQRTKPDSQRRQLEEKRRASPVETMIAPQQDVPSVADEQRTNPDPQRRQVEEGRRASPIETMIAPQQDAPSVTDEQQRTKPDPQRREVEEARPPGTQSARIAAGIGHSGILEESRPELFTGPVILQPKTSESLNAPPTKRCPKCKTTYENALLAYCSYDATKLVSADDPLFNVPVKANDWARPTLWALVAIMALVGATIGHLINNYLSREKGSSTPIAAQMEQPGNARKDVPIIQGALAGKEVNVPEPDYPAKAKAEGVSGTITVRVRVNKEGRVISARSSGGDWRLRAAAVKAAQKATFSVEKLTGREAIGTITYVFRL